MKKRVAPPKPPRPSEGWGAEEGEEQQLQSSPDHIPSSLTPPNPVTHVQVATPTESDRPLMRKRSMSSESVLDRIRISATLNLPAVAGNGEAAREVPGKPKVSSLIELFESKSPSSSPTRSRFDRRTSHSGVLAAARKEGLLGNLAEGDETQPLKRFYSQSGGAPIPPPKPREIVPPVPPRPLSTECGEEGVPIVPPRTPAPLLPPKPPGSMPPSVTPRATHRRTRSNDAELFMAPAAALGPPQLPPK